MKICIDELVRIAKEQCESVVRVFERHANETKNLDEMRSYRTTSHGRLHGIVETTIKIYACEFVNDENAYWEKVKDLRSYEDKVETKITEIFSKWYSEYLYNH